MRRYGLFWCLVVLILACTGSIDHDQSWLCIAGNSHEAIHVDVFLRCSTPAAIEPQNIKMTIVVHQLTYLAMHIRLEFFPYLGILAYRIVMEAAGSAAFRPPVVF